MQSKRIVFEKFEAKDFMDFLALVSDEHVTRYTSGVHTEASAKEKFKGIISVNKQHESLGFYRISNILNESYMGLAKLEMKKDNEAEVGYLLLESFWGKGFGSEISNFLVDYGQSLPIIQSIIGITSPENIASKKILMNSGLSFDRLGVYRDEPAEFYRIQF